MLLVGGKGIPLVCSYSFALRTANTLLACSLYLLHVIDGAMKMLFTIGQVLISI
jgi:hypothetical protein